MKIELLETVLEGRSVKTIIKKDKEPIVFVKGTVLEMSEASAQKYIEKGLAKAIEKAE